MESSGEDGVFPPDMAGPGDPCDTYTQGCPEDEKCNAYAANSPSYDALACFPLDPDPDAAGQPCTVQGSLSGVDSCELGALCWHVSFLEGTCVPYCQGTPDDPICLDPATICVVSNQNSLNLCLFTCDPLVQDCAETYACYSVGGDFVCAPDNSNGSGTYGDPCIYVNTCAPGFACQPDAVPDCTDESCCTPYCDVTDPLASAACPGSAEGQECVAWYGEGQAPPGHEDVGVCAVPI